MSTQTPMPPRSQPKRRWPWIVVAVVVLISGIAAINRKEPSTGEALSTAVATASSPTATGSAASQATTVTPASTVEPSTEGTSALESYATTLADRPLPTEAQVREIGLQLAVIQSEMASLKVSRVESWSDSVCGDIWVSDPSVDLVDRAKARFAGGGRPPLDDIQAGQVVQAITTVYCHR